MTKLRPKKTKIHFMSSPEFDFLIKSGWRWRGNVALGCHYSLFGKPKVLWVNIHFQQMIPHSSVRPYLHNTVAASCQTNSTFLEI